MVVKVNRKCHDHNSVVDMVSGWVESNVESGTMQESSKYLLCSLNMSGSEDPGKQTIFSFVELNQRLKQEHNTLITVSIALDTIPYGIRFVALKKIILTTSDIFISFQYPSVVTMFFLGSRLTKSTYSSCN